jgi:hypothetical protein
LRKLTLIATLFVLFGLCNAAFGQQVDAAFDVGTVSAPSSSNPSAGYAAQTIGGGTFLGFSGDFLLKKQFGVGGEINWRASQNLYQGYQPFRPIFWDFNGIWMQRLGKSATAELMAGIGVETVRFYNNYYTCNFISCTNYSSNNHFMGDIGGGIRFYVHGNFFVRPEARFYLVHNNNEFSSGYAARYGVGLGYTFGER